MRWMPGWLRSVGSGPLTWMLSNATSTAWINQHQGPRHQPKARQGEEDAAQNANPTKEKRNENQSDQHIRGRPGQGPALLYGGTGLRQEGRFQSGPISLADRGLTRRPGRYGAAAGAQQQPGRQSLPAGHIPARPARGHVLHRRRAGRLRAYESARRRVHHATNGCDGLQDRHAERHLRQSYSGRAADALVGQTLSRMAARWALTETRRRRYMTDREQYAPGPASGAQVRKDGEVDAHSR